MTQVNNEHDARPDAERPKIVARRRPAPAEAPTAEDVVPVARPTVTPIQQSETVAVPAAATAPSTTAPTTDRPRIVARRTSAAPAPVPAPVTPPVGVQAPVQRALGTVPARRTPAVAPAPASTPPPAPVAPAPTPAPVAEPDPPVVHGHKIEHAYDTVASEHAIAPGRVTPPERFDPANAWDFADLDSPAAVDGLDSANRLDPYWDGLWGAGSAGSWLSVDLAHRQASAGLGRMPAALNMSTDEATKKVTSNRGWANRLALLGALFSFRTMTAEQAAAFVGDKSLASAVSTSPASLFASGVLDLGVFSNGLAGTDLTGRGALFRPSQGNAFDDRIKDRLSWPEWVAVTGGQKWMAGTNYDRHNVLGTELALRLAEYTEIGTVLGERFSSLDHLTGSGIGYPEVVGDQRAADLTAVRGDGMRIAFEMTASTGTYFQQKVSRWARLLAERPMETSGLTVVFVIVQHPDRLSEDDGYLPRARTYQAIAAATKEFPGSVRDRVAERMGVATWREWFPARGKVHDAFFSLRVDRPTGRGDRLWEPADMLDTTDGVASSGAQGRPLTPRDEATAKRLRAVLDNAALLGNTPHWLRAARKPPTLWPLLLTHAGLASIPAPTPARPGRTKGRPLGQGVGNAKDTKPPKRLLGLVA